MSSAAAAAAPVPHSAPALLTSAHVAPLNLRSSSHSTHTIEQVSKTNYQDCCRSARDRWINVANALKEPRINAENTLHALTLLEVDLAALRDIQAREEPHKSLNRWYRGVAIKISILALTTLVSVAATAVATVDTVLQNNKDCQRPIAVLVLIIAVTALSTLLTLVQTGLSLKKLQEKKRIDAVVKRNMEIVEALSSIKNNITRIINSKKDHEYTLVLIKDSIRLFNDLPPDYIATHEDLIAIISNLIALTPEYSDLRNKLEQLHPQGSTLLAHKKADQAFGLDDSVHIAGGVEEVLQRESTQDIWGTLEERLGIVLPYILIKGEQVMRPVGVPVREEQIFKMG